MILLSASKVWLWVQRVGGIWSFLTWTRNDLSLHRHPEMSREVVEETLLILQENLLNLLLELGGFRIKVDVLSSWSPPNKFYSSICDWKMNFPFCLGNITSFAVSLFYQISVRPSFPTPQCLQPLCHPSKFPPRTERIRGTIQVRLSFQIDGFLTGLSQRWCNTQPVNQTEWSIL